MSGKINNVLPADVAAKYDCTIVPGAVIIQHPKELAKKWDLRKISMEDASMLAKSGKYLVEKKGTKESK